MMEVPMGNYIKSMITMSIDKPKCWNIPSGINT